MNLRFGLWMILMLSAQFVGCPLCQAPCEELSVVVVGSSSLR